LYWQFTQLGVNCEVIAPSLVPAKAGNRVKTDRRDAEKLARCYRNGDLTAGWVPDAAHEALRDLVRARQDAKQDQHRARQRLRKFLLRHGAQAPADIKKKWTAKYMTWLNTHVQFEQPALQTTLLDYIHEVHHAGERIACPEKAINQAVATPPEQIRSVIAALQALRGVAQTTAVTIVAEQDRSAAFKTLAS